MHRNTEPVLRFRADQFRRHCRHLDLKTAAEQGAHFGLSKWTVTRLLSGDIVPGERVIARILYAFPSLKFEDLFEVVEAKKEKAAA